MPRAPRKTEKELRIEREEAKRAENKQRLQDNPLRILKLLARAAQYPDEATFHVIDGCTNPDDLNTPEMRVDYSIRRNGREYPDDGHIYVMSTDAWEIQSIEDIFAAIDAERAEALRKRKIAQEAYDTLSEEQREALGLRYRPV